MSRPPPDSGSPRPMAERFLRARARRVLVVGLVLVVVAFSVIAAFTWIGRSAPAKSSGSPSVVPEGIFYTIPAGQFDAVAFSCAKNSTLNGTVADTWGNVTLYTMTPPELVSYAKTAVVSGYSWTSGEVTNHTTLTLALAIEAGQWDLVFVNGAAPTRFGGNSTVVWFQQGIELNSV